MLIDKGAKVNATTKRGHTALMYAALKNDTDVGRLLIKKKANIHATSAAGETALFIAKAKNNWEFVQMLQAAGAKR